MQPGCPARGAGSRQSLSSTHVHVDPHGTLADTGSDQWVRVGLECAFPARTHVLLVLLVPGPDSE